MSPRAAWRLEALGFSPVYDYVAGKADWLAAGLPTEGDGTPRPRVVEAMDRDVPTCAPEDHIAHVVERMEASEWDICLVVNDHAIVQGRLRRDRLDPSNDGLVEDVMEPGPATVRADADLTETTERMRQRGVRNVVVSTPEGVLLGVVRAEMGGS